MDDTKTRIRFEGVSLADANRYAGSLMQALRESHNDVWVEREKSDASTMDFGGSLVLALGAPATLAVARALRAWLSRNNAARISIETPAGRLTAENLESKDVAEIAKVLQPR
jgi:hypothetical protein